MSAANARSLRPHRVAVGVVMLGLFTIVACGDDDSTGATPASDAGAAADGASVENTGQSCKVAADCYPGIDGGADSGALKGEVQCLDRVTGGYCTHLCKTDADCCAVPGECRANLKQVCAPFESTGKMMCFLSCEAEDIKSAPASDAGTDAGDAGSADTVYCSRFAGASFSCRSTGGGKDNRKVCVP